MKFTLFILSFTIAAVSITFRETIQARVLFLTKLVNPSYTIFEGLPFLPLRFLNQYTIPANMTVPRTIRKAFLATEVAEGVGARVRRSIGTPQLRNFSPFLMLDHFNIAPGAGFPDHPHRYASQCPARNITNPTLQRTRDHHIPYGRSGRPRRFRRKQRDD
jgi:hypothetical protein